VHASVARKVGKLVEAMFDRAPMEASRQQPRRRFRSLTPTPDVQRLRRGTLASIVRAAGIGEQILRAPRKRASRCDANGVSDASAARERHDSSLLSIRTASCTERTWHSSSGRMRQRQKRNGQNSTRPTGPSFLRIRR
jgi:hypothetical protein